MKSLSHYLDYIGVIFAHAKNQFLLPVLHDYCRAITEIPCLLFLWLPNFCSHIWQNSPQLEAIHAELLFYFSSTTFTVFFLSFAVFRCHIDVIRVTALQQVLF